MNEKKINLKRIRLEDVDAWEHEMLRRAAEIPFNDYDIYEGEDIILLISPVLVILEYDGNIERACDFLKKEMKKRGWKIVPGCREKRSFHISFRKGVFHFNLNKEIEVYREIAGKLLEKW